MANGLVFQAHRLLYLSTLGSRVIKKKKKTREECAWLSPEVDGEGCGGSEAGPYLRFIDSCITQLKAQGPSRTCNESKEECAWLSPEVSDDSWTI